MKFIWKILLALIVFNGVLVLFSSMFTFSTAHHAAVNVLEEGNVSQYGNPGDIGSIMIGMFLNPVTLAIIGLTTAVSGLAALFKGPGVRHLPLAIGIGLFIGIFVGLWTNVSSVITGMSSNVYVLGLYSIISIIIGLIMVINVIGYFTGQPEVI